VKKQLREVETSIMPIGNMNIHKKLMCQSSLINSVSFVFGEFNRVAS